VFVGRETCRANAPVRRSTLSGNRKRTGKVLSQKTLRFRLRWANQESLGCVACHVESHTWEVLALQRLVVQIPAPTQPPTRVPPALRTGARVGPVNRSCIAGRVVQPACRQAYGLSRTTFSKRPWGPLRCFRRVARFNARARRAPLDDRSIRRPKLPGQRAADRPPFCIRTRFNPSRVQPGNRKSSASEFQNGAH